MATRPAAPLLREQALKGLDQLPTLSSGVGMLLAKLAFRNVAFEELAGIVSRDTLLCGHILRTVNSAGFSRARSITSVQQAMTLLGLTTLRRIAVSFSVTKLFSRIRTPPSWSRTSFNLHSAATAILAESISSAVDGPNLQAAFLAGLLHDIGKLLIAITAPQQYEMSLELASASGRSLVECEREVLGIDHAELSGLALTRWSLPEPVCRAVFHHHATDLCEQVQAHHGSNYLWLALVIQRADHFVNYLGIGVTGHKCALGGLPTLELPGYPYEAGAVLERFQKEWRDLSPFFR